MRHALLLFVCGLLAAPVLGGARGTGDLGVVVERASGQLLVVEHSNDTRLAEIDGLGNLSHASVVFSRDQRFAYVFGRDGALRSETFMPKEEIGNYRAMAEYFKALGGIKGKEGDPSLPQ